VYTFARYNYRHLHAIKTGLVPYKAEKELACFDILMVYSLKAYSTSVAVQDDGGGGLRRQRRQRLPELVRASAWWASWGYFLRAMMMRLGGKDIIL